MKWNESGFRPPLCTYRLNWARRTSWGWWDDWDDTVLQTQDSKFEPWRSEAEHATSRSRRLPTILTFTRGWGRNIFVSLKPPRPGTEPRTLAWKAAVLTTTLGPPPLSNKGRHAAEKRHSTTVGSLLCQRCRRWTRKKPTLPQYPCVPDVNSAEEVSPILPQSSSNPVWRGCWRSWLRMYSAGLQIRNVKCPVRATQQT